MEDEAGVVEKEEEKEEEVVDVAAIVEEKAAARRRRPGEDASRCIMAPFIYGGSGFFGVCTVVYCRLLYIIYLSDERTPLPMIVLSLDTTPPAPPVMHPARTQPQPQPPPSVCQGVSRCQSNLGGTHRVNENPNGRIYI